MIAYGRMVIASSGASPGAEGGAVVAGKSGTASGGAASTATASTGAASAGTAGAVAASAGACSAAAGRHAATADMVVASNAATVMRRDRELTLRDQTDPLDRTRNQGIDPV